MTHDLEEVALALVADGKEILAADETPHTLTKRFDTLGIQPTEKGRCAYREMLFTADVADFISGVILQDETIRQRGSDGTPLVSDPIETRYLAWHQSRCRREAACRRSG